MIQILERRLLLANVAIVNGILRIEGTAGADSISVSRFSASEGRVTDGGNVALTFAIANVRAISFDGGNGNDLFTMGRVPLRTYLDGGDGNDSLSASSGEANDTILGGAGDDYLYGAAGNDLLDGGDNADTMLAGAGNDRIVILSEDTVDDDFVSGGAGTDTVDASTYTQEVFVEIGNPNPDPLTTDDAILGDVEVFIGSPQADRVIVVSGRSMRIEGGGGNDTILTGRGNDTIVGGAGRDSINAGPGNDLLFITDSQIDTLIGGSGTDWASVDAGDILTSIEDSSGIGTIQ